MSGNADQILRRIYGTLWDAGEGAIGSVYAGTTFVRPMDIPGTVTLFQNVNKYSYLAICPTNSAMTFWPNGTGAHLGFGGIGLKAFGTWSIGPGACIKDIYFSPPAGVVGTYRWYGWGW